MEKGAQEVADFVFLSLTVRSAQTRALSVRLCTSTGTHFPIRGMETERCLKELSRVDLLLL